MPKCLVELTVSDSEQIMEFTKMLNFAAIPRVGEQLWIVAEVEEITEVFEVTSIMHRFDYLVDGCPAVVVCSDDTDLTISEENKDILLKTGWTKEDWVTALESLANLPSE